MLLDAFGPRRLMWGSDWPVLHEAHYSTAYGSVPYQSWHDTATTLTSDLSADERDWIFGDTVAARILLHVPGYRPGLAAAHIGCPLLVCVADRDVLAPPGAALDAAARAPRATVKRYPCQHFEIYRGPHFERAVADQAAFLVEQLRPGAGRP